jgi:PAS domain S-box-containing protein
VGPTLHSPHASASSELTDLLFEEAGAGLCLVAPDGTVQRANAEWLRSTGFSAEQVIGEDIIELFPDDRARVLALHARARAGDRVQVPRHVHIVDGRETWWEGSIASVPLEGGQGLLITAREVSREAVHELAEAGQDIAEQQRALSPEGDVANLQLADIIDADAVQSLLGEFYQLARIPMAVLDVEGKVLVGVGWQEICTRFHRVHPDTCKHCIESDTQLSAGVPPGEIRLYKCKNRMWDAATPILVGGHHLGNVFAGQFFFDDEPLDYELFRAQAAQYGFDEGAYRVALDAVPRLSRDAVAAGMAFLLKFAGMLSHLSFRNIRLARLVAERERLMTSLQESKGRLEESDRRKNEFLAMLSHELRNPLAPIRNSSYILRRAEPGGEQARRAQEVIERQTEHLSRLVDDLLDVTRIARGKVELRSAPMDVREVVLRAADDFRIMLDDRGILFRSDVPDTKVWADIDATRVTQVIGNLLHNAAKFTCRGDEVVLSLRVAEDAAEISVRDTGAGIDPSLLPHVFDAFVQGSRTLARSEGGLGLGLALAKGIVELHGGTMQVASAGEGQGAEFVVRLPTLAPSVEHAASRPPVRRVARGRRVLVVDDNVDAAHSLAEIVEMLGHAAEVAYDGATALANARANLPDVVLCDLGLPGMTGYEVAKTLRAEGLRAMQLVAVSGYALPEDVKRALEAGFDAHVAKPCDLADIERLFE